LIHILIGKRFSFSDNKTYELRDAIKVAKIISQELKLPIYILGEDERTPVLFEPKKRKKHGKPCGKLSKALDYLLPKTDCECIPEGYTRDRRGGIRQLGVYDG
jgi:hypothetical protein